MYVNEGFTQAEAVASLQDDDPELYRAYLSAQSRPAGMIAPGGVA
jgi:hypothetical protein